MTAEAQTKLNIARKCATLFVHQMDASGIPADVQLMVLEIVAKTIFLDRVKTEHQHMLLNRWLKAVNGSIKGEIKSRSKSR